MPVERFTENLVLKEMKIDFGSQPFGIVYPQGDVQNNKKIYDLLKKAGGKPDVCPLDDFSKAGNGQAKPEYIITFSSEPGTLLVVECKSATSKHESGKCNRPKSFAVDGVLYYAKYLKE